MVLNGLATIHVVWFYLTRVECHIRLAAYEQGQERTPFQYRLLLMAPLRWAHLSPAMHAGAAWLTLQRGFFPNGVRPEGIMQAAIDVVCVAVAGLVATRLYESGSRTGLLTVYVYPLTLLMVMSTYSLLTMHAYRFIYDLPSLAFFSLGFYFIYKRKHWPFAAVFVIGTINRETTILLLAFFVLAQCSQARGFNWRQAYSAATMRLIAPLGIVWIGWHLCVTHLFRANVSAIQPRAWLNLGILAVPFTWPQLFSVFAYLLPLVIFYRKLIRDTVLRSWLWALPVWFIFMFCYGVIVETRLFGELIPFVACVSALIAEEKLLLASRANSVEAF